MAFLGNVWKKKPKPPRMHSSTSQFASLSLASASLSSPLSQVAGGGMGWQKKAWEFYDVVPEMRLVVSYRASALSKVKLQIAELTPDGPELVTDGRSQAMLETLFGGIAHHGSSLARYAQHLTVPGETYTFVVKTDGVEEWLIVPPDHVNFSRKTLRFTHPITGEDKTYNTEDLYNFRLWQPHPHKFWEADSPTRGGISSLDKIQAIDASIKSTALSRLVGAGLYPMPLEASLPGPSADPDGISPEDSFQKTFHEVVSAARTDPNSAAASVPFFVWMPADAIAALKDKPISFWSDFDDNAADLRDTEIRRYATGQPLPTEMVTGVGDVNHWTGWQLSEEDLKFDIAPLAETICEALTLRVIQPVMGKDFIVQPDFSDLVTRPNRTPETLEIFNAGAASVNELREAAGLHPLDGGDTVGSLSAASPTDSIQVPSERAAPAQIDRAQDPANFAAADILARDLIYASAQWLLTHSGRANRGYLSSVEPLRRHVSFSMGRDVLGEIVEKVKPKYVGVIDDVLFDQVRGFVDDIFERRTDYKPESLAAWLVKS